MMRTRLLLVIGIVITLSSCASLSTAEQEELTAVDDGEEVEELIEETERIEDETKETAGTPPHYTIEVVDHPHVDKWVKYFTSRDKGRFQAFIDRGIPYQEMIIRTLENNDLPQELYYLALIESGFNSKAVSSASAVGFWQFIRATGRRYGLKVNRYVDERRDPVRASVAAALYLRDLYNVFNSWELALAAYNAGESRIMNAIMKANTRNYWHLVDNGFLPRETANYVPKFMAALKITRNLDAYGFREPTEFEKHDFMPFKAPSRVRLSHVAKKTGIPIARIKYYNPHLLRGITPPGKNNYRMWLPKKEINEDEVYASLRKQRVKTRYVPVDYTNYRIRRGDTLTTLSARFKVSVKSIKRLNRMRGSRLIAGKSIKIPTGATDIAAPKRYRVRRGDNLYAISQRFGITVSQIKKKNQLKHNRIYAGQILHLGGKG